MKRQRLHRPSARGPRTAGAAHPLILAIPLAAMLTCAPTRAEIACTGGLFGTAAQVLGIEPHDAPLAKRGIDGVQRAVIAGDPICHGETLDLPGNGIVRQVRIFTGGRAWTLGSGERFAAPARASKLAAEAAALLAELRGADGNLRPIEEAPHPRGVRTTAGATQAPFIDITTIRTLRELPRQQITRDLRLVLVWREGRGPYRCEAISDSGATIWSQSVSDRTSWCVTSEALHEATQAQVVDGRGPVVFWNLRWVEWMSVPRPHWIANDASALSTADRTAWALWLWSAGAREWRLQALAMLHELSDREWAAAYLRHLILSDQPLGALR